MKTIHVVYGVSIGIHILGMLALNLIKPEKEIETIAISMTTVEQPKKEEEKPKPPDPAPAPVARPTPHAAPPKAAPPPDAAPPPAAPDFGFVMSGGPGGPGGIAVPTAAPPPPPPRQAVKKLGVVAPVAEAGCDEPEVKPKATSLPHPTYTDEARAASIEGKVRVEVSLSPDGAVQGTKVLEGLGYGLDEAAMAALKAAQFSPATKCGKAIPYTMTIAIRFAL
jgi:protein TonB